jgi:hypothetical protein
MNLSSIAIGCAALLVTLSSHAVVRTVQLTPIEAPLVPYRLLGGDREFDGHGPDIRSRVQLRISGDRKALFADVYFHAKETVADWSETEGRWSVKVWEACADQRINRIRSSTLSEVRFRSDAAGPEIVFPGEDWDRVISWVVSALRQSRQLNPEQERFVQAFRRGLASVTAGNKIYLKPPTSSSGPVELFAIVGDTGGNDISTDEDPKDDTRIQGITFKPVVLDISGPNCRSGSASRGTGVSIVGATSAPLTEATESQAPTDPKGQRNLGLTSHLPLSVLTKSPVAFKRDAKDKESKWEGGK